MLNQSQGWITIPFCGFRGTSRIPCSFDTLLRRQHLETTQTTDNARQNLDDLRVAELTEAKRLICPAAIKAASDGVRLTIAHERHKNGTKTSISLESEVDIQAILCKKPLVSDTPRTTRF